MMKLSIANLAIIFKSTADITCLITFHFFQIFMSALTSVLYYSKAQMHLTANSRSKSHTRTSKVLIRPSCRIWTNTFKNHNFTHLSCQWLLIVVATIWPLIPSTFSINLKLRSEDNQMCSNRQWPRTHAKVKRWPSKKLRRSSRRPRQLISTNNLCRERAW